MKTTTIIQFIIVILVGIGCIYTLKTRDSHLGLDLSGGASLIYDYDFIEGEEVGKSPLELSEMVGRSITTINNRLDASGGEGVIVHTIGSKRIEVQIPAVKGKTEDESTKLTKNKIEDIKRKMNVPGQISFWFEVNDIDDKSEGIKEFVFSGSPVRLAFRFKDGIVYSSARFDTHENKGWVVDIKFDGATAKKFYDLTDDAAKTGRRTAIVLDGKVITMLSSSSAIAGGTCYIHGSFDETSSADLAKILLSGSMPIKLKLAQEFNVGPTLGKDSIEQSRLAIIIGGSAILLFMAVYYRLAGIISIIALVTNIALILVIMIHTKLVLTLPGIAGLLLTMGMAVDANILIYERIREELALGKSVALSIQDGFDKAFSTIFDSNLTTIITGIILFNAGTSALKGFATTLIIGLLVSMFTALFLSKVLFKVLLELNAIKNLSMMKIFSKTKIPFYKMHKVAFAISTIVIIGGLVVFFQKGDDMLDVDFKGGLSAMIKLKAPLSSDEVRSKMKKAGYTNAMIQNIEDNVSFTHDSLYDKYMIRLDAEHEQLGDGKESKKLADKSEEDINAKLNKFSDELIKIFDLDPASGIISINNVGADIAHDLVVKAIIAILLSMVAILIYVRIRFSDFAFGFGACVALLHDVLIAMASLGYWSLLPTGGRVDLNIVAALLTIVGFSINDTIVIFDRIRENENIEKARLDASLRDPTIEYTPMSVESVFDQAINQTLSRTIWTSLTVLLATLALFLYGGAVIHGFAFTMLIGILAGTYSTVFIASPIVVLIRKKTGNTTIKPSAEMPKSGIIV